ncbi:MAG: GDP-mannose 4,6-dehydratase [Verrucomicrobiota bacterium]
MNPKKSIVVGCLGQDGVLLTDVLTKRGDDVLGIARGSSIGYGTVPVFGSIDVIDRSSVRGVLKQFEPDEVYYLAAKHVSSEGGVHGKSLLEQFEAAHRVHVVGPMNIMDAMVEVAPKARFFYASSSLVFSGENGEVQDENTPLSPQGVYGMTKVQGMCLCREYRRLHNLHTAIGILYNHESHLRADQFLTAKIIRTAIRISRGSSEKLTVGSLASRVDWGYARDYVGAFTKILSLREGGDFVIATGEAHTVHEFITLVFEYLGLDPEPHIYESPQILTRTPLVKIGDAGKLRRLTGWAPTYSFSDFVRQLVKDHIEQER